MMTNRRSVTCGFSCLWAFALGTDTFGGTLFAKVSGATSGSCGSWAAASTLTVAIDAAAGGEAPTFAAAAFGAMKTGKAEAMLFAATLPTIIGGTFKWLANKGTKKELNILMNSITNANQPDLQKIIDRIMRGQSDKIGVSAAALSTAILANRDATPGGFEPDKEFTSLGDMISP